LFALHAEAPPSIVPGRPHHGSHTSGCVVSVWSMAPVAPQSRLSLKAPTNRAAA
jgi:hypothetical protein